MKKLKTCLLLIVYGSKLCAQNYDETKVPSYTLPEVLKTSTGQIIKSRSDWESKRRPEILSLFENNVYGQMPKDYDSLKFIITNETGNAINGKAYLKEVTLSIWKTGKSVNIDLIFFTPNHVKKPSPVFLLINNRNKRNTEPSRDTLSEFWPAEMVIDSGYAIAAFHVSDAAPDDKSTYMNGVLKLYP
jgi:hypothetical protein